MYKLRVFMKDCELVSWCKNFIDAETLAILAEKKEDWVCWEIHFDEFLVAEKYNVKQAD